MRSYRSIIDQMKSVGFNALRIPYSNEMLRVGSLPTTINYSLNPDLAGLSPLQILDRIVLYCGQVGLRVILDRHSCLSDHFNQESYWYLPGDIYYTEAQTIADWVMLARRYANNPTVIGADLWNEPKGTSPWTLWFSAAERIGNAILAENPSLLIIVEGTGENQVWWGSNLYGVITNPVILNIQEQLLYSVHDYGTSVFPQAYMFDPAFPTILRDIWTPYWAYLFVNNPNPKPIFVGEFGDPLTLEINKTWMQTLLNFMNGDWFLNGQNQLKPDEKGLSWTYWTVNPGGDTGGILNEDWVTVDQNKVNYLRSSFAPLLT